MSLKSLKTLAADRDKGKDADMNTRRDLLVRSIPTEVLAPYTALIGVIVGLAEESGSQRLLMRWIIYGAGLAAIVLYLGLAYARQPRGRKRRFPWVETLAGLLAFGAWGLVMPGSPLAVVLTGDDQTIWVAIITIGGAFLVSLLIEPMRKPSKQPTD